MLIDTGHAAFDRQTNSIGTGNFWANTLHGGFVRPYKELACNGRFNPPGHLQEYDLDFFRRNNTPKFVLDAAKAASKDESVILYAIFHWYNRSGRDIRVVHGYILTDADHKLIRDWRTGPTWKSHLVVDGVLPYIAWTDDDGILSGGA